MYQHWWWHSGWMWILWLAIILGVIWLVGRGTGTARGRAESPEEILKERYVRGEISREEYLEKLADLRMAGAPAPRSRGNGE